MTECSAGLPLRAIPGTEADPRLEAQQAPGEVSALDDQLVERGIEVAVGDDDLAPAEPAAKRAAFRNSSRMNTCWPVRFQR